MQATSAIPGSVTHLWLPGRDHGLRGGDAEVADGVAAWISEQLRVGQPSDRAGCDPPG